MSEDRADYTPATTEQERQQAEIESLEMLRHAALMQAAAYEKRLAQLGRHFEKSPVVDKLKRRC